MAMVLVSDSVTNNQRLLNGIANIALKFRTIPFLFRYPKNGLKGKKNIKMNIGFFSCWEQGEGLMSEWRNIILSYYFIKWN